jgi:hypothetical protein
MNAIHVFQAIAVGICVYAGGVHLTAGLRSEPRDRLHLLFAFVALLWAIYNLVILML